jgi:hypothetical protein
MVWLFNPRLPLKLPIIRIAAKAMLRFVDLSVIAVIQQPKPLTKYIAGQFSI